MLYPLQSIMSQSALDRLVPKKQVARLPENAPVSKPRDVVSISKENIHFALEKALRTQLQTFFSEYPEFKAAYPRAIGIQLKEADDFDLQIGPFPSPAIQPERQQVAANAVYRQISNFVKDHISNFHFLKDGENTVRLSV